jgi:hypothetical protein
LAVAQAQLLGTNIEWLPAGDLREAEGRDDESAPELTVVLVNKFGNALRHGILCFNLVYFMA